MSFNPPVSLAALQVTTPQITGDTLSIDSTVLPLTIVADLNTVRVDVSLFGNTYTFTNPTVVGGKNQFTGTVPVDTSQTNSTVNILGREFNIWQSNASFALGYSIVDSNGNVQTVTTAGTSGATQPTWNITGPTTDGGVIWTFVGAFVNPNAVTSWVAGNIYVTGAVVIDSNGNAQQATQGGTSGLLPPTWNAVIGGSTTDSGVQWICLGPAITPIFTFNLIFFNSGLALQIAPPSGLRAYKGQQDCNIEWVTPGYTGFLGVQIVLSSDPAGINPAYQQFGDLVSAIERIEQTAIGPPNVTTVVSTGSTTTTTVQTTQTNNFSAVDVPQSAVTTDIFYAMAATVIQDPNTNVVYQSQYSGPLTCGFVNLRVVSPTDFLALQQKENIAGRLITQITAIYPNLDLTPRSELRDLVIDPVSVELSNMSVREWFARCSTSISAISQVDNASGNGISDPVSSSPIKQQIARAYGLNPTDTQALINKQFDILAEQAGLTRGGSTASVVTLTFYSYVKPTTTVVIPVGAIVSSVADSQTPSLAFVTTGSATISAVAANSYYQPQFGWYAVAVPAQCQTPGTVGNVGAGSITQAVSNVPQGWNVTNLVSAAFGTDQQSNAALAEMIQARLVTGVDSGTRNGYFVAALGTPGITQAIVVAAGDLYMLRDYDPIRAKHVFGCVDIYTKGLTFAEQDSITPFEYENTSPYGAYANYAPLSLVNRTLLQFSIGGFATFGLPFYTAVEIIVQRSGNTFFLGTQNATFDNVHGYIFLNPNDMAYIVTGNAVTQATAPLLINGVPATNLTAIQTLSTITANSYTIGLFARLQSPLSYIPTLQPLISVNSVTGNQATGVVPSTSINLIRTQDFFLLGGSNDDLGTVSVNSTASTSVSKTLSIVAANVPIDSAMDIQFDSGNNVITSKVVNGVTVPAFTVLSTDLSTLYVYGVDYLIQSNGPTNGDDPAGSYHNFSLVIPSTTQTNVPFIIPTTPGPYTISPLLNGGAFILDGGVLYANLTPFVKVSSSPGQGQYSVSASGTYTFNVLDAGQSILITYTFGSSIPVGAAPPTQVIVNYFKFTLAEQLTFVNQELDTLTSNTPVPLQQTGFVYNTWLPVSYGNLITPSGTTLVTDAGLIAALVPYTSRYIKVTWNNGVSDIVQREGIDYTLTVTQSTGSATLARILTGGIPDGGTVKVSYFITETFTVATEYPAFVETLANTISQSQAAACSVLIKAMIANPIDLTLTVTLAPSADADTVDSNIRSAISITLNNASTKLYQSTLIQQVQAVSGVVNVEVPLQKCAKGDGAYDIGIVIPTQTVWNPLASDPSFANTKVPAHSFITELQVLPDATIPGGGVPDAYVGILLASGGAQNQPQAFRRASSIQDFLTNSSVPSFYIIGTGDEINATTPLSSAYAQRVLLTIPSTVPTPGLQSYFVTYQVYGEGGANDITISPTEYFVSGNIVINYISSTGTNAGGL
jgi:hypothetical protein